MIAPPRPALAALEAGIAHVARHHRPLPATGAATAGRRLALRVALNVARELDTLLGHAVAETAALAGVVLSTPDGRPARAAFAELRRVLDPRGGTAPDLARADRLREGLVRAVATRRALERHRLDAIYPQAMGASYRRVAAELARMIGTGAPRPVVPVAVPARGDDARVAHR